MMNHKQAHEQLGDFSKGRLPEDLEKDIAAHVSSCSACLEWVEIYSTVARVLEDSQQPDAGSHPASELVTEFALREEVMDRPDYEPVTRHLESCMTCRREAELVRESVAAARGPAWPSWVNLAARLPIEVPFRPLAVAAALVLAIAIGFLALGRKEPSAGGETALFRIAARSFTGAETVAVEQAILAEDVSLDSGSDVVLRSADAVAFGEGFSVRSGATLTVEAGSD